MRGGFGEKKLNIVHRTFRYEKGGAVKMFHASLAVIGKTPDRKIRKKKENERRDLGRSGKPEGKEKNLYTLRGQVAVRRTYFYKETVKKSLGGRNIGGRGRNREKKNDLCQG